MNDYQQILEADEQVKATIRQFPAPCAYNTAVAWVQAMEVTNKQIQPMGVFGLLGISDKTSKLYWKAIILLGLRSGKIDATIEDALMAYWTKETDKYAKEKLRIMADGNVGPAVLNWTQTGETQ